MVTRHEMKVFGIGLPKTGTTTLAVMLRQLGYNHAPYEQNLIQSVADGDREAMWRCVEAYQSFEDWPWPAVYAEVDDRIPDALFVLTLRRDSQVWLSSAQRHGKLNIEHYGRSKKGPARQLQESLWGPISPLNHPEEFLAIYDAHRAQVHAHFAGRSDKLIELCWENGDGWPELCAFLDLPVVEGPVPRENTSESRAQRLKPRLWRRGLRWAASQLGQKPR